MQRKETSRAVIVECFIVYAKRMQDSLINQILLVRINRNKLNYNKNEQTQFQLCLNQRNERERYVYMKNLGMM